MKTELESYYHYNVNWYKGYIYRLNNLAKDLKNSVTLPKIKFDKSNLFIAFLFMFFSKI